MKFTGAKERGRSEDTKGKKANSRKVKRDFEKQRLPYYADKFLR